MVRGYSAPIWGRGLRQCRLAHQRGMSARIHPDSTPSLFHCPDYRFVVGGGKCLSNRLK